MFYQLVSLEMYTREAEWWNLLTLMLENSPKLQVLKLTDVRHFIISQLAIFYGLGNAIH
jgi:hypothetical protein